MEEAYGTCSQETSRPLPCLVYLSTSLPFLADQFSCVPLSMLGSVYVCVYVPMSVNVYVSACVRISECQHECICVYACVNICV